MNYIRIVSPLLGSNCYIVYDNDEALVIDPCIRASVITDKLKNLECTLKHIIYTHAHIDHIIYGEELRKETGISTYGHLDDKDLYGDEYKNGSLLFGMHIRFQIPDAFIGDKDEIVIGNTKFIVIHTPGHTPGCICLYTEGYMFTGDTLFFGSIGRTDLGAGDIDLISASIKNKIYIYPKDTVILPGHGISTSIKYEMENNPYVYENK
jgi:glyoxylase-like metal-dependent hydrolase (beta-lactamase superfamily II)